MHILLAELQLNWGRAELVIRLLDNREILRLPDVVEVGDVVQAVQECGTLERSCQYLRQVKTLSWSFIMQILQNKDCRLQCIVTGEPVLKIHCSKHLREQS